MTLLTEVRQALREVAEPGRAPKMQAYMKSAMAYHGVPSPVFKKVCAGLFKPLVFEDAAQWQAAVRALWHGAEFREERYAAIALTGLRQARPFQRPDALPLYEELIVSGAWWDYVDDLATHRVRELLRLHPAEIKPAMLAWSRSDDMWKRRTSIICQNGLKGDTDLALLYACIEPAKASKEFFLRKAIGWALRELAWHDPAEVVRYVAEQGDRLSPLTRREALKNVSA
jgi:3-methyladenine DNA glycosylase AlkD